MQGITVAFISGQYLPQASVAVAVAVAVAGGHRPSTATSQL